MKIKIYIMLLALFFSPKVVFASLSQEALQFFNKYSQHANSYSEDLLNMYSPNVKIVREVIKPNGQTEEVIIPSERFFKELKIGQKTAKLRRYKNKYRNIQVRQVSDGNLKISAERQPSRETYWLKMYQILQPTKTGFVIKEEMMQTKVQVFLRHKQKGE